MICASALDTQVWGFAVILPLLVSTLAVVATGVSGLQLNKLYGHYRKQAQRNKVYEFRHRDGTGPQWDRAEMLASTQSAVTIFLAQLVRCGASCICQLPRSHFWHRTRVDLFRASQQHKQYFREIALHCVHCVGANEADHRHFKY